jgi:hypothetical protein
MSAAWAADRSVGADGRPTILSRNAHQKIQGFPGLSISAQSVDSYVALRLSNPGRRRTKEEEECLY